MPTPDTNTRTYDPKKIIITFGNVIITGVMDGTFVTVTQNGDSFEKLKGADGGVDRVNKNANDYSVALTLKQTSPSNDALSGVHLADKVNNTGKAPLTIKDVNGTSLFFAEQAWVAKEPDPEYGDSISGREWRLDTGVAKQFIGSNLV
jgi:hypothetical protein